MAVPGTSNSLRVAVMPAQAGPGVPEFLADALTEETGHQLSRLSDGSVQVAAQDSVSTLAARNLSAAQVGVAMHSDLVLKENLQALPGRYRLRIEMLSTQDASLLWDEDLLFASNQIHTLVADAVHRIGARIGHPVALEAAADAVSANSSPQAYEMLWRARSEWRTLQRHQMQDGLQRLQQAIEIAPGWMQARVEFVNLCVHQAIFGFMAPQTAADNVRRVAGGVFDPDGEALLPPLGWISFHIDRDLRRALAAFRTSAHLPHDRWVSRMRSMFALSRHRFREAIDLLNDCLRIDPFSAELHARLAWAHHLAGDAEASVARIESTLREFPEHEIAKVYASAILAYNGQPERAVTIAEDLLRKCPYLDAAMSNYAYALVCSGRTADASAILEQLEWLGRERFVLRAFTPVVHVAMGNHQAAIDELRLVDRMLCPWFFQALADPRLEPLREREDFKALAAILPRMEAAAANNSIR